MASRRTFALIPLLALALGGAAAFVPWKTCDTCKGESARPPEPYTDGTLPPPEVGWSCSPCRDRGRFSLFDAIRRRRADPDLQILTERGEGYWKNLERLFTRLGKDPEIVKGFPHHQPSFVPTDEGELFVLALSGYVSWTERHGPKNARFFLFDLDGALIDRVDLEDDQRKANYEFRYAPPGEADGAILVGKTRLYGGKPSDDLVTSLRRPSEAAATVLGGTLRLGIRNRRFVVVP